MRSIVVAVIVSLVLVGCGEQRIDASSEKAFESSLEQVRESLSDEERAEFDEALSYLATEELSRGFALALAGGELNPESVIDELGAALDGRSASEVIQTAQARQREAALEEIEELREAKEEWEEAQEQLSAFQVSRARLTERERVFGMTEPIIELSVENGTDHAVSRAYFRGVVASPGRSVPWIDAEFNYQIRGGIEPGESADWNLAPNMFSEWGAVDVPSDAVLTVETVRLDGADGNALFDATGWTERDAERLESLEAAWDSP